MPSNISRTRIFHPSPLSYKFRILFLIEGNKYLKSIWSTACCMKIFKAIMLSLIEIKDFGTKGEQILPGRGFFANIWESSQVSNPYFGAGESYLIFGQQFSVGPLRDQTGRVPVKSGSFWDEGWTEQVSQQWLTFEKKMSVSLLRESSLLQAVI